MQLRTILHFSVEEVCPIFGVLYGLARHVWRLRLPYDAISDGFGPDDVLLKGFCIPRPGADIALCFVVDLTDICLQLYQYLLYSKIMSTTSKSYLKPNPGFS